MHLEKIGRDEENEGIRADRVIQKQSKVITDFSLRVPLVCYGKQNCSYLSDYHLLLAIMWFITHFNTFQDLDYT